MFNYQPDPVLGIGRSGVVVATIEVDVVVIDARSRPGLQFVTGPNKKRFRLLHTHLALEKLVLHHYNEANLAHLHAQRRVFLEIVSNQTGNHHHNVSLKARLLRLMKK